MPSFPSLDVLQERLDTWRERYGVAGVALGVLIGDEVRAVASGVVNRSTGVAATPDTIFQIGSITKTFTATMIMQLVDEGRIDLDAPAATYVPGLRFKDDRATHDVTIRHLLTHTSGVDGDVFDDMGRGDDAVARYIDLLSDVDSIFEPGAMWSYCNAGFVVLGRIIELLHGTTWDQALRDRVITPLGIERMVTLPEEALLHRTAAGHLRQASGDAVLSPVWGMPRAQGPAGSTPCSDVAALLAFARMHIDGGRAPSGAQVLSRDSVSAMQQAQVPLDPPVELDPHAWGLGWMLFDWGGRGVFGHDGGTIGQQSSLRIDADARFAAAVLTNTAPHGGLLAQRIMRWLFGEVLGQELRPWARPPEEAPALDLDRYAATYKRRELTTTVERLPEGLFVRYVNTGPLASPPQPPMPLYPVDERLFLQRVSDSQVFVPVRFAEFQDGRPRYIFSGHRLTPRVS